MPGVPNEDEENNHYKEIVKQLNDKKAKYLEYD